MASRKGVSSSNPPPDGDWQDMPGVDVNQLSARLRFNPADAHIWLEGERMILLHLSAFGQLRRELVETLGLEAARTLLLRLGNVSGTLDAAIAKRAMPHAGTVEAFKAGPRLHALEGMVYPEEVFMEIDAETGYHTGEWIWRNSAEAEAHLAAFGLSHEPVCWTLNGYASAYTSAFLGRDTIYREVECRAMGAPHCRIVGKPATMWTEAEIEGDHIGIELDSIENRSLHLGDAIMGSSDFTTVPANLLVGESSDFATLMAVTQRMAMTNAPVLILGEPGVGKKSLGRAVHKFSPRSARPLLIVNCARRHEADLEIDLFGRERSGEEPARPGKLERLNGGTLLLEDIQSLSPRIQAKLLELLYEGTVERIGAGMPRKLDIRVIACANAALAQAVRDGEFRQDLYYRLSVCPIAIPPLRERRSDLPLLIRHFAELHAARYKRNLKGISVDAVGFLLNQDYPGNVTELEAMIERAVIRAPDHGAIRTSHLVSPADLHQPSFFRVSKGGELVQSENATLEDQEEWQTEQLLRGKFDLEQFEAKLIRQAVARAEGNLSKAARLLGITRAQLAYRHGRLHGDEKASE